MRRGALLTVAGVVATLAWTAWWAAGAWPVSGLSWHFFADGSHDLLQTDALSVYARDPQLQVGPLSLVVAGALDYLPGSAARQVALGAMALMGPFLLGLLALVVPVERRRRRMLVAALVVLPAWTVLAVRWGHLDDVLATAFGVAAVVAICRRHPVLAGLAVGAAIAAKPWAVGFVPLLLALPRLRLRSVLVMLATASAAWLPFILGDPGTLAALRPRVALVPGSGLHTLGVRGEVVPAWGRSAQFVLAPAAALAVAASRRWAGVMLVSVAVRLALDPQDNAYYVGSAAMAAVVFDLLGTRWLIPWTTLLTVILLWQPFVIDYAHRLSTTTGLTHWWFAHPEAVGWSHLAWAALVVTIVVAMPARFPTGGRSVSRAEPASRSTTRASSEPPSRGSAPRPHAGRTSWPGDPDRSDRPRGARRHPMQPLVHGMRHRQSKCSRWIADGETPTSRKPV